MENKVPSHSDRNHISENLRDVQARIEAACLRAGRDPQEVTLIAVSKTKPVEAVMDAYHAGVCIFGENYVQELMEKQQILRSEYPEAQDSFQWHMIGHLQKNKVKYLIGNVAMIHSVDSIELAAQIEKEAAKKDLIMEVLMEVNIAEEDSKWGFTKEEVLPAAKAISALPHIRLRGLMTSAPYTTDPESNRIHFRHLRELSSEMHQAGLIAEGAVPLLSMGMSGDYEVAIEEGATMVRVGTSIFGERNYAKT